MFITDMEPEGVNSMRLTAIQWISREQDCSEEEAELMLDDDPDLEYEYYVRYCLQELNLSPDEIIKGFGENVNEAQGRFIEDFKGEDELKYEQE